MSGLFGTLNVSNLGLQAQQKALDVVSHNIANASTDGYSRETVTMEAEGSSQASLLSCGSSAQVGAGVLITSINRVRDTFLDYQVRSETSIKGTYEKRESYLSQVESIINGTSTTGLNADFSDFFSSWQSLSSSAETSDARTVVAEKSKTLADDLNNTYNKLQTLKTDCQSATKDQIFQINDILNQVDKINQQIKNVKVSGTEPNDLMDQRDLLLDQLSQEFNINVDSQKFDGVDVSPGNSGQIKYPNLVDAYDSSSEKRFSYVSSISSVAGTTSGTGANATNVYKVTYYKNGDMTNDSNKVDVYVRMTNDQESQMDENRVLWADKNGNAIGLSVDEASTPVKGTSETVNADGGTYNVMSFSSVNMFTPDDGQLKGTTSVQADIDTYTDQLNKMAKGLAFSVNAVLSGQTSVGTANSAGLTNGKLNSSSQADYMPFFVNSATASNNYTTNADGTVTFANDTALNNVLQAESGITAGNISVNEEILTNVMNIKTRTHDDQYAYESDNTTADGVSDGNRALAVAQLANSMMNMQNVSDTTTRAQFFDTNTSDTGAIGTKWAADSHGIYTVSNSSDGMTLGNYFKDTVDKLAVQQQQATRNVSNQTTVLNNINQTKQSNSGVSIDEEMSNLIQYEHAYQANAKVISTIDSLLDVVINGLMK